MATLGTLSFDTKLNAQAVKDADDIKKRVLQKIGKGITIGVKPDFKAKDIKSSLQSTLNSIKPKVKVDIIVDQASASQAVQQALAKAGLTNNMTAGQLRAQRAAYIQQKMALDLARAQREASRAADQHSKSLLTLNSHFGNGISLGGRFSATVASIYSVYTLKNFVQQMIEIGGEFQKQRIALETMLGSLSKADVMYKRMKELAVESPFTFMDLMSYTKQLKAFQIPYNELFETTKRLGDISAGLGVDMNRLILAFGQVRAASFLRGQEVRQFTEAGIPLIEALSKKLTELEGHAVSVGDVFDRISKRQVSFGMVKDVLWELTDEGGQFYNMQEKLTESLSGKLDKLKDSYQIMVAEMAQGNNAVLGGFLDTLTKLVQYGDKVVGVLATLTGAFLAYKAAVVAVNAVHTVSLFVSGIKQASAILTLTNALQGLTAVTWKQVVAQKALNLVSNANWIALAAAAIATAIGLYKTFSSETESLAKSTRELRAEIQEEVEKMDEAEAKGQELIRTMFNESKAKATQIEAYKRLQELYPKMFKNMDFEQAKRMKNIELLKMETQAAREAMKAKLDERIKDAQSRKAKLKSEYDQYNINTPQDLELTKNILRQGGGEEAVQKFEKLVEQYNSVNEELDELNNVQEEVNKRIETANKNRSSKWWNTAKKLAGDLTMYAPKEDQDFEEYFEQVAKNLNSRKALLDKMTKDAPNYDIVKKDVDTLTDIFTSIGGKLEELSKFKPSKNNKDEALEAAKTKLKEYKAFLTEYKKYYTKYTKEDSIRILEDLFPGLKGQGAALVNNYLEMLDKLRGSLELTTEERKKWANDIDRTKADTKLEREAEKMKEFASEVELSLKNLSKQWEIYKKIVDETGNRQLAIRMSGFSETNRADALRKQVQGFLPTRTIEFGKVINMSDDEIDKYARSLGLVGEKADGISKALKEWRDAQIDLRNEALQMFSSMIAEAGGLGTEIDKINEKYDDQIRKLREIKDLSPEERNARENQAERSRKLNLAELFVNNIDFEQLFDTLGNIAIITANEVKDEIEKMISGSEAKNLSQAELERYLKLQKTLTDVGGQKSISPFSKSAWVEVSSASSSFKRTMQDIIANLMEYNQAVEDEQKAMKDLANAHDTESGMIAQIALNDAKARKEESKKKISENAKIAKQQGQELTEAQKKIIAGAESVSDTFKQVLSGSIHDFTLGILNIISGLKGGNDKAGGAAQSIGAALSELGVESGNVYGAIIAAILQILDMLRDDAAGIIRDLLDDIFDAIVGIFDDLASGELIGVIIGEIVEGLANILSSIGNLIVNIFDGSFFTGLWDGITSAFNNDDEYEELIEQSKKQVELLQKMSDLLDKSLDRTLGGVYTTKANKRDIDSLKEYQKLAIIQEKLRNSDNLWYRIMSHGVSWTGKDTNKAVNEALKSQSYYDTKLAEMYLQRDELYRQLNAEQNKKNSDDEAIQDFKNQIEEVEDEIEHFAEDMAKALYDIDVKSWAKDLGDALFDAWQKGEDGAEAFRKKAREIITDVAKNIATVKLIETALAPVLKIITDEMEKKDGKLDEGTIELISKEMELVGTTLPDSFNALMEGLDQGLQNAGLGSMKDDSNESSTMSNTIKGITENTADLLASYINAIRADLSVMRVEQSLNLPLITTAVQRTSALAEIQVTHMQQVAANTLRNADAAEKIYDLFHSVAPDGTRIRI